jgi:hypothetical protein
VNLTLDIFKSTGPPERTAAARLIIDMTGSGHGGNKAGWDGSLGSGKRALTSPSEIADLSCLRDADDEHPSTLRMYSSASLPDTPGDGGEMYGTCNLRKALRQLDRNHGAVPRLSGSRLSCRSGFCLTAKRHHIGRDTAVEGCCDTR